MQIGKTVFQLSFLFCFFCSMILKTKEKKWVIIMKDYLRARLEMVDIDQSTIDQYGERIDIEDKETITFRAIDSLDISEIIIIEDNEEMSAD